LTTANGRGNKKGDKRNQALYTDISLTKGKDNKNILQAAMTASQEE
jgi:hypothetical protein